LDEKELLSAYIDNALNDDDRISLEERLLVDAALTSSLKILRQTDAILLAAYDAPMKQLVPQRFFDLLGIPNPARLRSCKADLAPVMAANDNAAPWWCVSAKISRALGWASGRKQR
jgi:anti-sigma factor RsiW